MNPQAWHTEFLRKRSLTAATGLPLYTYKISAAEYKTLNDLLKISNSSAIAWDVCFVLYAVEWWRREYNGGAWSWDPICMAVKQPGMAVGVRSELVSRGFRKWQRPVNEDARGNDYIGTVVVESGLPLKVLQDDHYLVSIITDLYREFGLNAAEEKEQLDNVKAVAEQRLPQSLRKVAFYQLLLQFVSILVRFNESFGFAGEEKPVEVLDRKHPQWREEFPLRMETMAARNFIDTLLAGVTKAFEIKPSLVAMNYRLIAGESAWGIEKALSIHGGIHPLSSMGIEAAEFENLSQKLEIYLITDQSEKRIGFAFKNYEQTGFHFDRIESQFIVEGMEATVSLYLLDPRTYRKFPLPIANNFQLNKSEPLIFGPVTGKGEQSWSLCASGSCQLHDNNYYIVISSVAHWQVGNGQLLGEISHSDPVKKVYRFDSDCKVEEQGNLFKIELTTESRAFDYEFIPGRSKIEFYEHDNRKLFIGMPKIYKTRHDGAIIGLVRLGMEYHDKNGQWKKFSRDIVGKIKIRLAQNGITAFTRTLQLLPEDFFIQFDTAEHKIILINSKDFNVTIEQASSVSVQPENGGHTICFANEIGDLEFCMIRLTPLNEAGRSIVVKVPFPKDQVYFNNNRQERLAYRATLYMSDLYGARLYVSNLSAQSKLYACKLTLLDPDLPEEIAISQIVKVNRYSNTEIPLVTFRDAISFLLSTSKNIDAKILLSCEQYAAIEIGQFELKLRIEPNGAARLLDAPADVELGTPLAFRLDRPFVPEDQIKLQPAQTVGEWNFSQAEGLWFIFPSVDAARQFRPLAFSLGPIHRPVTNGDSYEVHQTALLHKESRMLGLANVWEEMASDYNHPDWLRLTAMYESTGHVRLTTQDAFIALSKHSAGLMAATFMFPQADIERFSDEFSILWIKYPVKGWLKMFNMYQHFLSSRNLPPKIQEMSLDNRLNWLAHYFGLTSLKWIIEHEVLKHQGGEVNQQILRTLIDEEYNGAEQKAGLRARHTNKWPDQIRDMIVTLSKSLPHAAAELLPDTVATYQKAIVLLPFIMASATIYPEQIALPELTALQKFRIQEMIAFDREWFFKIFNLLQAYLWTNQLNHSNYD